MEPQLPKPQLSPEVGPGPGPVVPNGEFFNVPKGAEQQAPLEQGRETREHVNDGPQGDPMTVQVVPAPPPMPVIDDAQPVTNTSAAAGPAVAADEDLIEKEWVEKAKKVVAETRNDPHAQDTAVRTLQADYLRKRYGKVIDASRQG